jgi:hypothetical protein
MNGSYEQDRLQCQAQTTLKKRCARVATHHSGGKLLCEHHHGRVVEQKLKEKPSENK